MSDNRQEFLETLIRTYVPKDAKMQAKALEAVGLLGMQADRDSARTQALRASPEALTGPKAQKELENLQTVFRKVVGLNIFDTGSEDLVRATWALVHAVVSDERAKVSDGYENSGIHDTPDLDVLTELDSMLEIPGTLSSLLWNR